MPAVLFIALGSWGDVAPVLSVAASLRARGTTSRIATASDYVGRVLAAGHESIDLGVQIEPLLDGPIGRQWAAASAQGQKATVRAARAVFDHVGPSTTEALIAAIRPGETIVSGIMTFALGAALAEVNRARHAQLLFLPISITSHADATAFPLTPWPSGLNRWSCGVAQRTVETNNRDWTNAIRARLSLAPWTADDYLAAFTSTPVLYGVSPQFIVPGPDWPAHVITTGHLLDAPSAVILPQAAPQSASMPPGLPEFLDEHPGAIYIGLGSFAGSVEESEWAIVLDALALCGRPAVVAVGGRPELTDGATTPVFPVGSVDHNWLFPRMAAVVHHAGAGTSQRATLCGVPSVAVPILGDQPYWSRRLHTLGLGPRPIPHAKLSPKRLADAITRAVSNPSFASRAQRIASLMRTENGPATAAATIAQL